MKKSLPFLVLLFIIHSQAVCQWEPMSMPTQLEVKTFEILNETTFYVADSVNVYFSDDAGESWQTRPFLNAQGQLIDLDIYDVDFVSSQLVFAVGKYQEGVARKIFKSTNGGISWAEVFSSTSGSGSIKTTNEVAFLDSNNGTVFASNGIRYRTTNGGGTWSTSYDGAELNENCDTFGTRYYSALVNRASCFITATGNLGTVYFSDIKDIAAVSENLAYFIGESIVRWDNLLDTSTVYPFAGNSIAANDDGVVIAGTNDGVFKADSNDFFYPQSTLPGGSVAFVDMEGEVAIALFADGSAFRSFSGGDDRPVLDLGVIGHEQWPVMYCPTERGVEVLFKNYGLTTVNNFTANIYYQGEILDTNQFEVNILPGEELFVLLDSVIMDTGVLNFNIEITSVNGQSDLFALNNTYSYSFIPSILMGEYNVGGPDPDFAGYAQINDDIGLLGICSQDVTLNVYSNATTPWYINNDQGLISEDASLTLRGFPSGGASRLPVSAFVRIDGINNLKFENFAFSSGNATVVEITGESQNIVFENCSFGYSGSLTTSTLVKIFESCTNISFIDCEFNIAATGINILGTTTYAVDINVENCSFINQSYRAIEAKYISDVIIKNSLFTTENSTSIQQDYRTVNLSYVEDSILFSRNELVLTNHKGLVITASQNMSKSVVIDNSWFRRASVTYNSPSDFIYLSGVDDVYIVHNTLFSQSNCVGICIVDPEVATRRLHLHGNLIDLGSSMGIELNYPMDWDLENIGTGQQLIQSSSFNSISKFAVGFNSDTGSAPTSSTGRLWQLFTGVDSTTISVNSEIDPTVGRLVPNNLNYPHFGGIPVFYNIYNDIDGYTRSATNNSIGCHWIDNTQLDLRVISLKNRNGACAGSDLIEFKIGYQGEVELTSFDYALNLDGSEFSGSWNGSHVQGDTLVLQIEIPSLIEGAHTGTLVLSLLGDSISGNDSLSFDFNSSSISGVYTIGDNAADFPDIQSAISSISNGICDDVYFEIQPGFYSVNATLGPLVDSNIDANVYFKSANNDAESVVLQSNTSSSIFTLTGADYIHFESLTIRYSMDALASVIAASNSSDHISFKNCIFGSEANTSLGVSINKGIDWSFDSCVFYNLNNAIYSVNTNLPWQSLNLKIKNSEFFADLYSSTDYIFIYCNNGFDIEISGNRAQSNQPIRFTILETSRTNFFNNEFYSDTSVGIYLGENNGFFDLYSNVYNNSIISQGTVGFGSIGQKMNWLHNTIVMHRNMEDLSSLPMFSHLDYGFNFINNIVCNFGDAPMFGAILTNPNEFTFDYNVLYNLGDELYEGSLGFDVSNSRGSDFHSYFSLPQFVSDSDIHLFNDLVCKDNGSSDYLSLVSNDRDGELRDLTPDIGSDEFDIVAAENQVVILNSSISDIVCPGTQNIILNLVSYNDIALQSLVLNWSINGVEQLPISWTGEVAFGEFFSMETSEVNFEMVQQYYFEFAIVEINGLPVTGEELSFEIPPFHTSFSGTLSSEDFLNDFGFSDVINLLNSSGLCGPLTIVLESGQYSIPWTIEENVMWNGEYPIIITSGTGISSDVSFSSQNEPYCDGVNNVSFENVQFNCLESPNSISNCSNINFNNCSFINGPKIAECYDVEFNYSVVESGNINFIECNALQVNSCAFMNGNSLLFDGCISGEVNSCTFRSLAANYAIRVINSYMKLDIEENYFIGKYFRVLDLELNGLGNDYCRIVNNYINADFNTAISCIGSEVIVAHNTIKRIAGQLENSSQFMVESDVDNARIYNNAFFGGDEQFSDLMLFYNDDLSEGWCDYNNYWNDDPNQTVLVGIDYQYSTLSINGVNTGEIVGYEENATFINPSFSNSEIAIPLNPEFYNQGVYLNEVDHDIFGFPRSTANPTHGCFETNQTPLYELDSLLKEIVLTDILLDELHLGDNQLGLKVHSTENFLVSDSVLYTGDVTELMFKVVINGRDSIMETWHGSLGMGDTLDFYFEESFFIEKGRSYNLEFSVLLGDNYSEYYENNNFAAETFNIPMAGSYTLAGENPDFESFLEVTSNWFLCDHIDTVLINIRPISVSDSLFIFDIGATDFPFIFRSESGMDEDVSLEIYGLGDLINVKFQNITFVPGIYGPETDWERSVFIEDCQYIVFDSCTFTGLNQEIYNTGLWLGQNCIAEVKNCSFINLNRGVRIETEFLNGINIHHNEMLVSDVGIDFPVADYYSGIGTVQIRYNSIVSGSNGLGLGKLGSTASISNNYINAIDTGVVLVSGVPSLGTITSWFYNNVVISEEGPSFIKRNESLGTWAVLNNNFSGEVIFESPEKIKFQNNIVITETSPCISLNCSDFIFDSAKTILSNNCYFREDGQDLVSINFFGENDITNIDDAFDLLGLELNSWNVNPNFLNDSLLYATSPELIGTAVSSDIVVNDFYGNQRDALPDIGAVEQIGEGNYYLIWPGDCNSDYTVNLYDIIPIAFHNSTLGIARPTQSIDWIGLVSSPWSENSIDQVNLAWVDSNGDGEVSLADTLAVDSNLGSNRSVGGFNTMTHLFNASSINVNFEDQVFESGDIVPFQIFLDGPGNSEVEELYSVGFTIELPTQIIGQGSLIISFESSVFQGNVLRKFEYHEDSGMLTIVLTKTDGEGFSAQGLLCSGSFILQGVASDPEINSINVGLINSVLLNSSGTYEEVEGIADVLNYELVSVDQITEGGLKIEVSPNPTKGQAVLTSTLLEGGNLIIEIYAFDGTLVDSKQIVSLGTSKEKFDISDILPSAAGAYLLKIKSENQLIETLKLIRM